MTPGVGCTLGSTGFAQHLLTCVGNMWLPRKGAPGRAVVGPLWTKSSRSGQQPFVCTL